MRLQKKELELLDSQTQVEQHLRLMAETAPRATLVITGLALPESRARALAGDASACLLKPVDDQLLLDTIAVIILPP